MDTYTITQDMMDLIVAIAYYPPAVPNQYAYAAKIPWDMIQKLREHLDITPEQVLKYHHPQEA